MIKTHTFEEVSQDLKDISSPEEKIILAISFMKDAISSEGKPRFRDFWRMKKNCFELFSLETNPIKRNFFWKEYSELLKEAHRLQEIFKEEIEFHAEQIKLAIAGLESEIQDSEKVKSIQLPQFDRVHDLKELEQRARFFESLKGKVIALREEVLGLEIRIHLKNELLDLLKKIGDQVFPDYKKTVHDLTKTFQEKVDLFFHKFSKTQEKGELKRDIRLFQSLLKEIHISHEAYKKFREKFSDAWKSIEEHERESFEERAQIREEDDAKRDLFLKELKEIPEDSSLYDKMRDLSKKVKTEIRLKENYLLIQKEINLVEEAYAAKHLAEQEKRKVIEQGKRAEIEEKANEMIEELKAISRKQSKIELEKMQEVYADALKISEKSLNKSQLIFISHYKLALREAILKKQGASSVEWKALGVDTKNLLDKLRKELHNCGLDIEFAAVLTGLIEENKERMANL
jgi:hypothetical protein